MSQCWGKTPLDDLLTHLCHAWALWKSQGKRMHKGWMLPIACSSTLLLSVMKKRGDQFRFHFFSTCSPSVRSSSLSYWGMIVATTLPIPRDVLMVAKKHGKPYLVVRYTLSIIVTTLPYFSKSSRWCCVCMTKRNVVLGPLVCAPSPSSPAPVTRFWNLVLISSHFRLLTACSLCGLRADSSRVSMILWRHDVSDYCSGLELPYAPTL